MGCSSGRGLLLIYDLSRTRAPALSGAFWSLRVLDKLSLSIRGTARIPAEATGFPFPEGKHAFPGIFPHRRWVGVTSLWPPLFDVGRTVATNISRSTFLHLPVIPNRLIATSRFCEVADPAQNIPFEK